MNNALPVVRDSAAPPTILGQGMGRIPTGGKIRAGIKVLTRKAAADPAVLNLYREGVAAGLGFDDIEAAIRKAFPSVVNPMVPKNVEWFTVRPGDFANPKVAAQLLDTYGEVRADGVRRLYRFPVVFPSDQWQHVMPHELVAWGASERKYWSQYGADGCTRHCMMHAAPQKLAGAARVVRMFGPRKAVERKENGGLCMPENCEQFQERKCNLSGKFIFFIPGIESLDAFELHTNSFYAMSRAVEKFNTVSFLRGGRLSGFLDRQGATFYISKVLRPVTHIDDNGKAERTDHWIIELDADIDVTALLRHDETPGLAADAARLLGAPAVALPDAGLVFEAPESFEANGAPEPSTAPPTYEEEDRGSAATQNAAVQAAATDKPAQGRPGPGRPRHGKPAEGMPGVETKATAHSSAGAHTPASGASATAPASEAGADAELAQLYASLAALGVDAAAFDAWTDREWGQGWRRNRLGRARAAGVLNEAGADPQAFGNLLGC